VFNEKLDINLCATEQVSTDTKAVFFDEAESGFMLFDDNLYLKEINASFLRDLQINREEALGRSLSSFCNDIPDFCHVEKFLNVLWSGEPYYVEEITSSVAKGTYLSTLKAFKAGNSLAVVARQLSLHEENAQEQQTFIYRASHDMRGPLARILGVLNLSDGLVKDVDEARHFFKIIRQQAEGLDTILRSLVQGNDTRRSRIERSKIDFWQIIEEALQQVSKQVGYSQVRFEKSINVDVPVYCDAMLLKQIFVQLIENSIKFKKTDGSQAVIKVAVTQTKNGVVLDVEDNGQGIPMRLQDKVFQMFYKSAQEVNGNGLGLYLVRQIAGKLGAKLSLRSDTNRGAHFSIFLPEKTVRLKA
jgi:signal transduction histidine kinase